MNQVRDISRYSKSTVIVQRSMNKWVQKFLGILAAQGESALLTEISKLNFSVGYLNSIIRLMEKHIVENNMNIELSNEIQKLRKRKRVNKKRKNHYYEGIRKMVLFALKQVSEITKNKLTGELIPRCTLEAYVLIILVFLTALRSNEVTQLSVHDLYKIKNKQVIYIRIKKKQKPVIVGIMQDFFDLVYPTLIYILAEAYDQIVPSHRLNARFPMAIDKENFINNPHVSVLADTKLFSCHKSTLNKEIKEMYEKVNGGVCANESVGAQGVRCLILTELISIGDPEIAAYFTRHQNPLTTTTHYNEPSISEGMNYLTNAL